MTSGFQVTRWRRSFSEPPPPIKARRKKRAQGSAPSSPSARTPPSRLSEDDSPYHPKLVLPSAEREGSSFATAVLQDPKYRDIPKKNLPLAEHAQPVCSRALAGVPYPRKLLEGQLCWCRSLALTIQRVLPFWRCRPHTRKLK